MSKKKKRRRPRKQRRKIQQGKPVQGKATNIHHLCWIRKKWHNGWPRLFRDFWYCKIEIPKNTLHAAIHQAMHGIPVPDGQQAKQALYALQDMEFNGEISEDDDIETRLSIIKDLFPDSPTGRGFAEQLSVVQNYRSP